MFEDSLMESGGKLKTKQGATTLVSFILQLILIGVLVLLPLIFTEALPKQQLMTFLVAPPPPPPPPPPPAAAPVMVKKIQSELDNGQLRTPTAIPKKVQMIKEDEAPPPSTGVAGVVGGVPGGVPGGAMGGVLGGIVNSPGGSAQGRDAAACSRFPRCFARVADPQSAACLPAVGATGAYSGCGGAAGADRQGRCNPEFARGQRASDVDEFSPGSGEDNGSTSLIT